MKALLEIHASLILPVFFYDFYTFWRVFRATLKKFEKTSRESLHILVGKASVFVSANNLRDANNLRLPVRQKISEFGFFANETLYARKLMKNSIFITLCYFPVCRLLNFEKKLNFGILICFNMNRRLRGDLRYFLPTDFCFCEIFEIRI